VVGIALVPAIPHKGMLTALSLLLMAPFMAGVQTIFQSACKRYTTAKSRGAGFNVWYLFMNIGAAGGGISIDIIRKGMGLSSVHVFTLSAVCAVVCYLVAVTLIRSEQQ